MNGISGDTAATVILTRPEGKNACLLARFAQTGLATVDLPALQLTAVAKAPAMPDLQSVDLAFFVSGFAVDCFFALLADRALHWPAGLHAACVGPGTAEALQRHGLSPDCIFQPSSDQTADSPGLLASLRKTGVLRKLRTVLIVSGTTGSAWFENSLRAESISVSRLALYERQSRVWDPAVRQQMLLLFGNAARKKFVVLTSPQGVEAFVDNLLTTGVSGEQVMEATTFVVTHPGQAVSLQQAWHRHLPDADLSALHILQSFPRDDAIFRSVTISD